MKKKIAILGAGFVGLTTAYRLSQKGYRVHLFEKEGQPGGLARSFKQPNWQWSLEESYHHFFSSDYCAINLAKEVGVSLIFKRPITATYSHGKIFPLDSPISLLNYPYLTLSEKLRTGFTLAYLKLTPFWKSLEKETAKNWLIRTQGVAAWQELWEPLFVGKFGKFSNQVTMSWFWARIKKRSPSLGYPEGGFQNLADKLAEKVIQQGGKIYLNHETQQATYHDKIWQIKIKNNNSEFIIHNSEFLISTLPTPVFLDIFPQLPKPYIKKLSSISHLHALSLILELKKPFLPAFRFTPCLAGRQVSASKPYWLNINDRSFPFLAVVEHTNFMDKKYYAGNHLLYIGNYLPDYHPYLKKSAEELFEIFKPYLQQINPDFKFQISNFKFQIFTSLYAQPVVTTRYSKLRPTLTTPLPNLYLGNLDCVYPWDRGVNYAVELGNKLAELLT